VLLLWSLLLALGGCDDEPAGRLVGTPSPDGGEGEGTEGEGEGPEGEGEGQEGEGEGTEGEGEGQEGEGEGTEGEGEGQEGEGEGTEGEGEGVVGGDECDAAHPCPDPTWGCYGSPGQRTCLPVPCARDGDCPATVRCGEEGRCTVAGCLADEECPAGTCDLETGHCRSADPPVRGAWYRGNLHTHSWPLSSDCGSPEVRRHSHVEVADWFAAHGYAFLVFTEHDAFETREELSRPGFLVLDGMELTAGTGRHHGVHVGALGIPEDIPVPGDLHGKIAEVLAAGGLPVVNHPEWSLEIEDSWHGDEEEAILDILASQARHMEIWNTHTETWVEDPENDERLWDRLLTQGKRIYGVATDDSHGFQHIGGSFIEVWAPELSAAAILEGIDQGRFYASTGVRIHRIQLRDGRLQIGSNAAHLELLGPGEELRAAVEGGELEYDLRGEPWVRVRATRGSDTAWSQPLFADEELELGAVPDPVAVDPRDPAIVLVEDLTPGDQSSSSYPGTDINEVLALLPDGTWLRPQEVVAGLTAVLDPGNRSQCADPAALLDDGLHCGPDWAGFTCLGGRGGRAAVRFPHGLPPGTLVRVVEVNQALCATASATPEPWQARACWGEELAACALLGESLAGGIGEFIVGEEHRRPAE
jgi:hypothetical protein